MLFKRIYVLNDIKILRFTISFAFEKDVWGNEMKLLWFAISHAFQKDLSVKWFQNT